MPPVSRPRLSDTDACPGALRLHAAADGPLARVRLPGGLLTGAQLGVLGDVAREWGDGGLELTSRANVQLRALTAADPDQLAGRLTAAGLLPSATHETVRNIAAPALADAPLRALVGELDGRLCADPALAALPGRFLFGLGDIALDADVAAVPAEAAWTILFAGVDAGLRVPIRPKKAGAGETSAGETAAGAKAGAGASADVVGVLLAAAHAFLAERAETPGKPAWRLRELPDGPTRVALRTAALLGVPLTAARRPAQRPPSPPADAPIGLLAQPDGRVAVGATVPLGRLDGPALSLLTRAERLVITPWRGVVVPDLTDPGDAAWLRDLAAAGLPVSSGDRWSGVTACAGRPGCAKSLADVRADATAATRFAEGLPVHWVGCERGCGSPPTPHVRVEATRAGYTVDGVPALTDLGNAVVAARRDG